MNSRIPAKCREIGKAEMTKWDRGIHHKKGDILPFLCGFWSDLAN